jgi:hypothetical protein
MGAGGHEKRGRGAAGQSGRVGWRGITEMGVWWRWWKGVHGVIVARGVALRITTALNDKIVGRSCCSMSNNGFGRLRV